MDAPASLTLCNPERGGCGFDLRAFRAEIRVAPDRAEAGEVSVRGDNTLTVFCPVCGSAHDLALDALGVLHRARAPVPGFVMWKLPGVAAAADGTLALGELKLRFRSLSVLRPEEICHPAVPAFRKLDGTLAVPDLPVRPAFADCLDLASLVAPQVVRGRYQVELPLRGARVRPRVELPLMSADPGRVATDPERDAFRGVNVRFWPRVAYRGWKRFFLSVSAVEADGQKLFAPERPLRIEWLDEQLGAHSVTTESSGGRARVAMTGARPTWLSLGFDERERPAGGGLFRLPTGDRPYANNLTAQLGVDFGTSNTCIAYLDAQGTPQLLPLGRPEDAKKRTDLFLQSGEEPRVHDAVDTWIPMAGFGPAGDLLPSEILLRMPTRELFPDPERIRALKPVEDFTIPTAGVRVGYAERDHIVSEFKWRSQIEPAQLREETIAAALQETYLDFAVFFALGQIYAQLGEAAPGNVEVQYAFPLVLSEKDRISVGDTWKRVAERISSATGLSVTVPDAGQAGDESNTAAVGGKLGFLDRTKIQGRLIVDVGGGTTDLVVLWPNADSQKPPTTGYVSSVRYAGGTYVAALTGASERTVNCMVSGVSVETLRRLIREAKQIRHVIDSATVVRPDKRTTAERRASLFFAYLVEYLARLVVAPLLSGEAPREPDGSYLDPFTVELIPLGNGWGFAGVIDPDGEEHLITVRLQERIDQLVTEINARSAAPSPLPPSQGQGGAAELAGGAASSSPPSLGEGGRGVGLPKVILTARKLKALPHPKAAVAIGLLLGGAAAGPTPMRRIVGYTTTVDGKRKVPWYLTVQGEGAVAPAGEAPIMKSSYLGWEPDEPPRFPQGLPAPHTMDEGLRHTVRVLLEQTAPRDEFQHRWLRKSPFEVLLEELFRKAIPNDGVPY